jgi:hypothetical protein
MTHLALPHTVGVYLIYLPRRIELPQTIYSQASHPTLLSDIAETFLVSTTAAFPPVGYPDLETRSVFVVMTTNARLLYGRDKV